MPAYFSQNSPFRPPARAIPPAGSFLPAGALQLSLPERWPALSGVPPSVNGARSFMKTHRTAQLAPVFLDKIVCIAFLGPVETAWQSQLCPWEKTIMRAASGTTAILLLLLPAARVS